MAMREKAGRNLRVVRLKDVDGWSFSEIGIECNVSKQRAEIIYKETKARIARGIYSRQQLRELSTVGA